MEPDLDEVPLAKPGRSRLVFFGVCLVFLAAVAAFWQWRVTAAADARPSLSLASTSFASGGPIPRKCTCEGQDLSPGLRWSGAPSGTRSFVLIVHDPDAPVDFTHWLAYRIPPAVNGLPEGASTDGKMPAGTAEGINGFSRIGYAGPCPPPGEPHRYMFRIYALDFDPHLAPGATREQVETAIKDHVLAEGRLMGTYRRAGF
ncbi:MAG TPA: YbhB/YbcL family Raf kinase inhibitor-like protein [Terracidiphilus sp.]|nr:YbhB/YbcL family Raf kinase inhibitor-like protein [Terracidiphilus sp.]